LSTDVHITTLIMKYYACLIKMIYSHTNKNNYKIKTHRLSFIIPISMAG